MVPIEVWRALLEEGEEKKEEKRFRREVEDEIEKGLRKGLATLLVGVRRAGKSSIMLNLAERKDGAYINFEDERLIGATAQDLTTLAGLLKGYTYWFFDEIQNISGWEKFVRRIAEGKKHVVVVSGSNAALLRGEYATALTGRKRTFFITPLSYREAKTTFGLSLEEYLEKGGFPEPLLTGETALLKEYREDIFYRDILPRAGIRAVDKAFLLYNHLLNNPGMKLSYKRLRALTGLSHPTIDKLQHYFEEAFVLFFLRKLSPSSFSALTYKEKAYPIDNGLVAHKGRGKGLLLEAAVAQHLLRFFKGEKAFGYLSGEGWEVDFSTEEVAIQVAYELHEENLRREEKGLRKAPQRKKLLVALYGWERSSYGVPAERFLLHPEEYLNPEI